MVLVRPFDGPQGGGRGEHSVDFVLGNYPEKNMGCFQGRLEVLWNGRQNFESTICRLETLMLPLKSNGTVSNYNIVPLDFTGSIKVSSLQIRDRWGMKISELNSAAFGVTNSFTLCSDIIQ